MRKETYNEMWKMQQEGNACNPPHAGGEVVLLVVYMWMAKGDVCVGYPPY